MNPCIITTCHYISLITEWKWHMWWVCWVKWLLQRAVPDPCENAASAVLQAAWERVASTQSHQEQKIFLERVAEETFVPPLSLFIHFSLHPSILIMVSKGSCSWFFFLMHLHPMALVALSTSRSLRTWLDSRNAEWCVYLLSLSICYIWAESCVVLFL